MSEKKGGRVASWITRKRGWEEFKSLKRRRSLREKGGKDGEVEVKKRF